MKKGLFLGMAAFLMAGLASCSSDDLLTNSQDKPLEADQTYFANISISNVSTRAGETPNDYEYKNDEDPAFDKGEDYENYINSIYLIFYDKEGDRVSTTQVLKENVIDFNNREQHNSGDIIYQGVVQIDVKHGSLPPAYVMCFINPITSQNFEINPDFASLKSLQATTRPMIIAENTNYFAMSKSVYFGKDRVTNEENQKIIATPLEEGVQMFKTRQLAEEALTQKEGVVDIYVERYAAKVSLDIEESAQAEDIKLTNDYTLEFTPEYWAVNAYESNTYICKSFLSEDMATDLTYDDLQKALTTDPYPVWKWNNSALHRCYWAQSPAYYAADYPRVADDIYDNGADSYALGYYSYNQMAENASKKLNAKSRSLKANNGERYKSIYARENTVAGSALKEAWDKSDCSPKAAVASAVIVGTYKLKNKGSEVNTDMFYVMGNKTNGYTVFENTDAMTDYFVRTTIPFAMDNTESPEAFFDYDNGKFLEEYDAKYRKYFKVVHPYAAAREGLTIDSRFVTIQLNPEVNFDNEEDFYVYLDGRYTKVTNALVDSINKEMLYAAGTVQGYNGGKVFYNIPIKHLGFYREGNANKGLTGTESTFDWTKCISGDFGLVRNHSYRIVVDQIIGLGNGIPNPEDPIVPPTDPEEYFIGARIIVLNWAVVPTQHVIL